jgi:hypothetical protein
LLGMPIRRFEMKILIAIVSISILSFLLYLGIPGSVWEKDYSDIELADSPASVPAQQKKKKVVKLASSIDASAIGKVKKEITTKNNMQDDTLPAPGTGEAEKLTDEEIAEKNHIDTLSNALINGTLNEKLNSIRRLGLSISPEAYELVLPFVREDNFDLAVAAGESLLMIDRDRGFEQLLEVADHNNPVIRSAAMYSLGKTRDKRAYPILVNAAKNDAKPVRLMAIYALGYYSEGGGPDGQVQPLLETIAQDSDPEIKDSAIRIMMQIKEGRAPASK